MVDIYDGPFSGISDTTEIVSAAAQTEILGQIDAVMALIPDPSAGVQASHPDFDDIPPATAEKLRTELTNLKTRIDAAPTA